MAENIGVEEDPKNAKQALNPSNGPQTAEGTLDNSLVSGGGDAVNTSGSVDANAKMEVNANAEINTNPEVNANCAVDDNANAPTTTTTADIDCDAVQDEDSLDSLEPPPAPQPTPAVSSPEDEEERPEQVVEGGEDVGDVEDVGNVVEKEEEAASPVDKEDMGADLPQDAAPPDVIEAAEDEVKEENGEENQEQEEEGAEEAEEAEELLSPLSSEPNVFDTISDQDTDSIEADESHSSRGKGTNDATEESETHADNNTSTSEESRSSKLRKEPVIDASKLREREERSVNNRRAHMQKKSDTVRATNEQRRAAFEERKKQQELAEEQRKEAIMRRSRERTDNASSSREKRRSWSAFGSRELPSPGPTPSASTPRGRSSERPATPGKSHLSRASSSNLSSSKRLSSSVTNIYRPVRLVRLGPNDDDWFEVHIPQSSKKGSPQGGVAASLDARSPVGSLRTSPRHHQSTPNLASFAPRDSKSTHSTPTHGPRPSSSASERLDRLSRPRGGFKSPSSSTTNLSTPPSSTKRAPSPRTVGRPPSPRQRTPLSARSSNASATSVDSRTSGGSTTPKRPPSPRNTTPRDKSSDSHSSSRTPSNKSSSSSNPPPIKKSLTPSAAVAKPTPIAAANKKPKTSTPSKKESPTSATPDKPKPPAPSTPTADKPKASEAKQNGSDSGDSKPELTAEERAKQALAERRRQAREKAEREAELEKQRQEQLKREEEERLRKEEEERIRQEEEARRLAEEHRKMEEERLRQAEEDHKRQMEEERIRLEEEEKMKAEEERKKQEEIAKRQEELARQEEALALKHKKEEEERDARRKRVDEIMKRARRGAQNKDDSTPGSPDSEQSTDSPGERKTNGISSSVPSSVLMNDKFRHLLSGNRSNGSTPVSGDEENDEVDAPVKGDDGTNVDVAAEISQNGIGENGATAMKSGDGFTDTVAGDANPLTGGNTGGGDGSDGGGVVVEAETPGTAQDTNAPVEPTPTSDLKAEDKESEASDGADAGTPVDINVEPSETVNNGLPHDSSPHMDTDAVVDSDNLQSSNNGPVSQDSSLVIDPKGGVDTSLLIEPPAPKTDIEITNGEGGLGDKTATMEVESGVEANSEDLKIGLRLGHAPQEDAGIEGSGQSGDALTSEI